MEKQNTVITTRDVISMIYGLLKIQEGCMRINEKIKRNGSGESWDHQEY